MANKVADMTIDELRRTIREVVQEVLDGEEALTEAFSNELLKRSKSKDLISHEEVWGKKSA